MTLRKVLLLALAAANLTCAGALMTAAPVSGVAGIVTFGWLVIRRVSVEERALREAAR